MSDETLDSSQDGAQLLPWQKNKEMFKSKQVVLISLGFFASSAAWSIFNSNVNVAFENLLGDLALVGFLMTLDNIVGIVLQPITGNLSDKTKSRFGRRMPYILIGLPVSAISFLIIPLVEKDLILLLIFVLIFNVSMGAWRAPTVALMPDFVAPRDRSKGNGIVNFLGGFGAIFAFVVGGLLITDDNPFPGFLLVSIVMLLALVILFLGVKEPDTRNWDFSAKSEDDKISIIASMKQVVREPDKSTLFMLLAIFCWFLAYQGLEALWTVYSKEFFGLDRGTATFSLTFVALPFMLFAVPAGLVAKKITRRWTIISGLVIGTIAFLILEFIKGDMGPVYVLFPVFGIAWALININSIAMIWQMAPSAKHIGTYTGLYYFFSFLAAIVGPTVLGFFMDYVVGRENMFVICVAFFLLAIFFMSKVKRGEPELTDEEREARQAAINKAGR